MIERVAVDVVETPLERTFVAGGLCVSRVYDVFVAVSDQEGRTGLGYSTAWSRSRAELLSRAIESLSPQVVGLDPLVSDAIRRVATDAFRRDDVGAAALLRTGLGVLELAALELAAIQQDLSVSDYLGTSGRLEAYLSGGPLDDDDDERRQFVERARAHGFRTVKVKIDGSDAHRARNRVEAVLELLGARESLAVDANQTFTPAGCRLFLSWLNTVASQVAWLEEPIDAQDIRGLAAIRREGFGIKLAAGETLFGYRALAEMIQVGACDLVILNPTRSGGPSALSRIRDMATAHALGVLSHVNAHVSVHLLSDRRGTAQLEYLPWWDEHFDPSSYSILDGRLAATGSCVGFGFNPAIRQRLGSALR